VALQIFKRLSYKNWNRETFHRPRDLSSHKSPNILKCMKREAWWLKSSSLTGRGETMIPLYVSLSLTQVPVFPLHYHSRQRWTLLKITSDLCDWLHPTSSLPIYLLSWERETSNSGQPRATDWADLRIQSPLSQPSLTARWRNFITMPISIPFWPLTN